MKKSMKPLLTVLFLASGMALAAGCFAGSVERVSVTSGGEQANKSSDSPVLSSDGRYVAYISLATNLVVGDTNNFKDVFLKDRISGEVKRVSVANDGTQANGDSTDVAISGDGRYVVFTSLGNNLVQNDNNNAFDVFVYDNFTNTTRRISESSLGTEGNGGSDRCYISKDGRYVLFQSNASNLVDNDTNNARDAFVHDLQSGTTKRISVSSDGNETVNVFMPPDATVFDISADGQFSLFATNAGNLLPNYIPGNEDIDPILYLHDQTTNQTTRISYYPYPIEASISADGRYITATTDSIQWAGRYGHEDIFVFDTVTKKSTRILEGLDTQSNGIKPVAFGGLIPVNEDYIVFYTNAPDITGRSMTVNPAHALDPYYTPLEMFTYELQTGELRPYLPYEFTHDVIFDASISADGRFTAIYSRDASLVVGDTNNASDVFLIDRDANILPPPILDPAKLVLSVTFDGKNTLPKPGPVLPNSGSPGTWKYEVKNIGDEVASTVRVFSKQIEPVKADNWSLLCSLGEITGDSEKECSSESLIIDGAVKILLSAQGKDKNGEKVSVGTAAWYIGGISSPAPSLSLEVLMNGSDNDNVAPGEALATGDTATFTYNITNTGPVELTAVRIFDRTRSPVSSSWGRACEFSSLQAGETVSCEREATVESGDVERQISVQSFYQSEVIRAGEFSYYSGK